MNCAVCGSELPAGALFCGECGSSVSAGPRQTVDQRASDTSVVVPIPAATAPTAARNEPTAVRDEPDAVADEPDAVADEADAVADEPGGVAGGEDVPERARIQPPAVPPAYLVRFSTGETAAISGPGLIGRNPAAQPGEEIPTMIPITDEGRSVSKTHLEIGVMEGRLWVSDRYSSNGSMRVEPGGYQRRLEPGRRYLIESDTRIAIGEQWVEFVLPDASR